MHFSIFIFSVSLSRWSLIVRALHVDHAFAMGDTGATCKPQLTV